MEQAQKVYPSAFKKVTPIPGHEQMIGRLMKDKEWKHKEYNGYALKDKLLRPQIKTMGLEHNCAKKQERNKEKESVKYLKIR